MVTASLSTLPLLKRYMPCTAGAHMLGPQVQLPNVVVLSRVEPALTSASDGSPVHVCGRQAQGQACR